MALYLLLGLVVIGSACSPALMPSPTRAATASMASASACRIFGKIWVKYQVALFAPHPLDSAYRRPAPGPFA